MGPLKYCGGAGSGGGSSSSGSSRSSDFISSG
jgi:hypothetical protein